MKEAAARALEEETQSTLSGDAVVFEGVTYRYDPRARPALDGCSFAIRAGRRVVVVGENGAGKSTMLALAAGARLGMDQSISIHGAHPSQQNLRASSSTPRVAYLGPAFKQQLETCAAISKATPFGETLQAYKDDAFQERAKRLMALLHVDDRWRTGLCSSGQKTRLQLVLQLAPRADVRVLDELTRDLDALARHRVLAFLERDAATCLYATHVFQGLDGWATDVLRVRRGGCVVEEAPLQDVAGALLRGLRNDADLPPPPPPVRTATKYNTVHEPPGGLGVQTSQHARGRLRRARLDDGRRRSAPSLRAMFPRRTGPSRTLYESGATTCIRCLLIPAVGPSGARRCPPGARRRSRLCPAGEQRKATPSPTTFAGVGPIGARRLATPSAISLPLMPRVAPSASQAPSGVTPGITTLALTFFAAARTANSRIEYSITHLTPRPRTPVPAAGHVVP